MSWNFSIKSNTKEEFLKALDAEPAVEQEWIPKALVLSIKRMAADFINTDGVVLQTNGHVGFNTNGIVHHNGFSVTLSNYMDPQKS